MVLRVPEFTLKDVKIESEKVEKEANQLAADTNAATKARMAQAKTQLAAGTVPKITAYFTCLASQLTATRATIATSYAAGETEYRRAIAEAQNHGAADEVNQLTAKMGEMFKQRDAELAKVDTQIATITQTQTRLLENIASLGQ